MLKRFLYKDYILPAAMAIAFTFFSAKPKAPKPVAEPSAGSKRHLVESMIEDKEDDHKHKRQRTSTITKGNEMEDESEGEPSPEETEAESSDASSHGT